MHEWALAEAVVDTTLKVIQKEELKGVSEVIIRLGELQQIDKEIFQFALNEIIKEQSPILKETEFRLLKEDALIRCKVCGVEWKYSDAIKALGEDDIESIHFIPEMSHIYMKCPKCASHDFEIVKGRGVWVESIKGSK